MCRQKLNYNEVIMSAIASQITSLTIVYSTVYSDTDQSPHHCPLCGEFTGDRWIPHTNGQLQGKCFHLMTSSWYVTLAVISYRIICLRHYIFYIYYPLFRARSWNNGVRCMSFYIRMVMMLNLSVEMRILQIANTPRRPKNITRTIKLDWNQTF